MNTYLIIFKIAGNKNWLRYTELHAAYNAYCHIKKKAEFILLIEITTNNILQSNGLL